MPSLLRSAATCALLSVALAVCGCATARPAGPKQVEAFRPLPPVESKVAVPANYPSVLPTEPAQAAAESEDSKPQPYLTPERLWQGYTIVVVGVNGDNIMSAGLAPGLVEGGYPGAVEVVDWTTGYWPLFLYHLRADERHQTFAHWIADKIVSYQTQFPGRPVNVVGYSAGAVVAVEALEALPRGTSVDRALLLAGAISPLYDLSPALAHTRQGILSYYQAQDVVALWAGTTLAGTADGTHLPSAGAVGFWTPLGASEADRQLYRDKLVQLPYSPRMALSGNLGGHFQAVGRKFVANWIAPELAGSNRTPVVR